MGCGWKKPDGCVQKTVSSTRCQAWRVTCLAGEQGSALAHLSSPGYLLLGLLAMLLVVETFSELPQARALVKFFGSSGPMTAEDQGGILGQDDLALSTLAPPAAAPQQAPTC